jgi:hypothetical protein
LTALSLVLCSSVGFGQTLPPLRGVYPLGMSSMNSGVTPESGFTYSNLFLFYSRNELKGSNGEITATGNNSVLMDLNTLVWVSQKTILGGAKLSLTATLLINNNSLTSDAVGPISGGGGFGDSYYQPFILGWQKDRTAIRVVYGFLAPTGKFKAGENDNVGSGYWVPTFSSGQTFYLTKIKRTSLCFPDVRTSWHSKGHPYPSWPDLKSRLFADAKSSPAQRQRSPNWARRLRSVANHRYDRTDNHSGTGTRPL